MHIPSARNQENLLAAPELIRLTTANPTVPHEPALLVKCTTLNLKYLVQSHLRLHFVRIGTKGLVYVLEIDDGTDDRAALWSVVRFNEELLCLRRLMEYPVLQIFLYNELATNLAWTQTDLEVIPENVAALCGQVERQKPLVTLKLKREIKPQIASILAGKFNAEFAITLPKDLTWNPIKAHYSTNESRISDIFLWDNNEGAQQEEMAVWIAEGLVEGLPAFRSPQVQETSGRRELTDILVTDGERTFIIESKALSIFSRPGLPTRSKLSADLIKHVMKASKQLIGAARNIERGSQITDSAGCNIAVNPKGSFHAIILVPDLTLFGPQSSLGAAFFCETSAAVGGFFHVLDPVVPVRMIQAANMISRKSRNSTPLMALDRYLISRAKLSFERVTQLRDVSKLRTA